MSRPKRSLGQNFLVDGNLQRKIVEALGAGPDDEVLEIGPGRGALTQHLVGTPGRLVLVELDDELADDLERRWGGRADVEVVRGDVLERPLGTLSADPSALRVLGNIPYNITSPILFHLLEPPRPAEILVMVQREVADRILAEPGTGAYGALTVGVRSVAGVERVLEVPRTAFRPRPRVDSTVIRVLPRRPPPLAEHEEEALRTVVRAAFQWRRKQLQKILRSHPDLEVPEERLDELASALERDLRVRPERLSPADFVHLAELLREMPERG